MCQTHYDIQTHRHRFATWAAARAAQRGLGTVEEYRDAIESIDLRTFVENYAGGQITQEDYKTKHTAWCEGIVQKLSELIAARPPKKRSKKQIQVGKGKKLTPSFGRAAKVVAVYIKTAIVLAGMDESPLAAVAYPPVDRILLRSIIKSGNHGTKEFGTASDPTTWTTLTKDQYYSIVVLLRNLVPEGEPFWKLEEHWTVVTEP